MWNSYVQAAEVSQRRTAVSIKCFQLYYTFSDRLLAIALPLALSIFIPLLLWRVLSCQLFCVHCTKGDRCIGTARRRQKGCKYLLVLISLWLTASQPLSQNHDDYADGVRLRPWTAATNGPIFNPQVMYEHWEPWWNDIDRGKLFRPTERSLTILPAEPSSSKSGGTWRRRWWI
jgi:hypothetical protein